MSKTKTVKKTVKKTAPKAGPRALTKDECLDRFLDCVRANVEYWADPARETHLGRPQSVKERMEGLAFSILNLIDGMSGGHPAILLKMDPHPLDKAYLRRAGENWTPAGIVINDESMLHELFYKNKKA
jgi:hypothetical protein